MQKKFYLTYIEKYLYYFLGIEMAFPLLLVYTSQYIFDMHPCIMCLYERIPYWIGLGAVLIGAINPYTRRQPQPIFAVIFVLMLAQLGLSVYHTGLEQGIFSLHESCTVSSDANTVEEMRKELLEGAHPSCDRPEVYILGFSLASWNIIYALFVNSGIIGLWYIRKKRQKNYA